MAISFIGSATPGGGPSLTTSFNITIPTVAVGDLLILACTNRDATTAPTVTDDDTGGETWTKKTSATSNGTLWYKRATSGTSGKTISASGFTGSTCGVLVVLRGAASGDPFDQYTLEDNASGDETHAGFTPSSNGCWIGLAVHNVGNDNAVTNSSTTSPGALTEGNERTSTGGADSGCSLFGLVQATAGATGNFTWAQTNGVTVSQAFAIKPDLNVTLTPSTGALTLTGSAPAIRVPLIWNASDKQADLVLTNGDTTVRQGGAAGSNRGIRSIGAISRSSGKWYTESTVDNLSLATDGYSVGLANTSQVLTNYLGQTTNGVGYFRTGGVWLNAANLGSIGTFAQTNRIRMAADLDNNTIWFSVNGGNWNGSGTANPATNTGGLSISSITKPVMPALSLFTLNEQNTLYGEDAEFVYAVPSGFQAWGAAPATNVTVTPATGALALTGFAPTIVATDDKTLAPATGALTLTGFAPTVTASDHKTVGPGTGALTLTGFAPSISVSQTTFVQPGTGALTLTGFAPTVTATAHVTLAPGTGALALTGFAPTLVETSPNLTLEPGAGALVLTGFAPTILGAEAASADFGGLYVQQYERKRERSTVRDDIEAARRLIEGDLGPVVTKRAAEAALAVVRPVDRHQASAAVVAALLGDRETVPAALHPVSSAAISTGAAGIDDEDEELLMLMSL